MCDAATGSSSSSLHICMHAGISNTHAWVDSSPAMGSSSGTRKGTPNTYFTVMENGYLRVLVEGSNKDAHHEGVARLLLWMVDGPPPNDHDEDGDAVPWVCMHLCNNKRCLNVSHLAWGSRSANTKGNSASGGRYHSLQRAMIDRRKLWVADGDEVGEAGVACAWPGGVYARPPPALGTS